MHGVSALSCVFTDNQCFLDNELASPNVLVVQLGYGQLTDVLNWNAGAIMASNNFVQTSALLFDAATKAFAVPVTPVMILNPKDKEKTLTVLGNISSGDIFVGAAKLGGPWAPLNVQNV